MNSGNLAAVNVLSNTHVQALFTNIITPAVKVIFALAVAYFVFGVFTYIRNSDDPAERQTGGKHILYGTVGLFIMFSVWGIIALIRNTLGVHN